MGFQATVDDAKVKAKFNELYAKTKDTKPAMESAGSATVNNVKLGFRASKTPHGSPWLPLKVRAGKPLLDNGILRNSITHRATATVAEVGTNLIYGPIHQFGGTITAKNAPFLVFKVPGGIAIKKSVNIPARPFLPISQKGPDMPDSWMADVVDAIEHHLGINE